MGKLLEKSRKNVACKHLHGTQFVVNTPQINTCSETLTSSDVGCSISLLCWVTTVEPSVEQVFASGFLGGCTLLQHRNLGAMIPAPPPFVGATAFGSQALALISYTGMLNSLAVYTHRLIYVPLFRA